MQTAPTTYYWIRACAHTLTKQPANIFFPRFIPIYLNCATQNYSQYINLPFRVTLADWRSACRYKMGERTRASTYKLISFKSEQSREYCIDIDMPIAIDEDHIFSGFLHNNCSTPHRHAYDLSGGSDSQEKRSPRSDCFSTKLWQIIERNSPLEQYSVSQPAE